MRLIGVQVGLQTMDAHRAGTMCATEQLVLVLDTVTEDAAAAAFARWGQLVNGALETVEGVVLVA